MIGRRSLADRARDAIRPEPWSGLSPFGRVRRVVLGIFAVSAGAMAWAANTADSDWNITQKEVEKQFG